MQTRGSGSDAEAERARMVESTIRARGAFSEAVLQAMRAVPRDVFVPEEEKDRAYADGPLPIGAGQTISQPYIVAVMTEWAAVGPEDRVLEIGTGSGYQTAILARLAKEVYTIERIPALGRSAERTLKKLGMSNVALRIGDGYDGWPEAAPFQAILVAAAAPAVPLPLVSQLAPGGRLVIPIGEDKAPQSLVRYVRGDDDALAETDEMPVRFVPFLRGCLS